jgi:hypothetical protein
VVWNLCERSLESCLRFIYSLKLHEQFRSLNL